MEKEGKVKVRAAGGSRITQGSAVRVCHFKCKEKLSEGVKRRSKMIELMLWKDGSWRKRKENRVLTSGQ